ncbi:MAG: winged helix-turn-helix domain-containing protein [Proteobacteria bacterium]|nr:winged helix-turn-helix domain-containing protein [Pseudomonadota bacterium]
MSTPGSPPLLFRYRFGSAEFDESRLELKVAGLVVEIEPKPLAILSLLLRHAGEVVTKEELLDEAWGGRPTVENVIANAIAKLRGALGEGNAALIVTQPRVGYRLNGRVERSVTGRPAISGLDLEDGGPVPGRPNFVLSRLLGGSDASEVWLARQERTREVRVYKFSRNGAFLAALKREATLARVLQENTAEGQRFARLLDWNFDSPPFFLEYEYGGENLEHWAAAGQLEALDTPARIGLFLGIVDAVAAAHDAGVLHQDLKPANVLVTAATAGGWHVRLTDFGSSRLLDPDHLARLGITRLGLTTAVQPSADSEGTPFYLAPELLTGASASVRSDVYALGVMLYQLLRGDFRQPLAAGWEAHVADALLREDIALAAAGDPERRLQSAGELAARLRRLDERRASAAQLQALRRQAEETQSRLARTRARRPWVIVTGLTLAAAAVASSLLALNATRARQQAERETGIAAAVNSFLAEDLLARSSPYRSGEPDPSLAGAMKAAAANIDERFNADPAVAARLHQTMARAFDDHNDWDAAAAQFAQAAAQWRAAEGAGSPRAIIANLQLAQMQARSYRAGTLERARALLREQEPLIAAIRRPPPELAVWLASARGMVALIGDDPRQAAQQFHLASLGAAALPAMFDAQTRLSLKQREAFALIRLGDGRAAEALQRELIRGYAVLRGADSPEALRVRLNLVQALMIQYRYADAVAEATALYPRMLATFGPDHELTLQLMTTRAQCNGSLEHFDAAIREGLEVHRRAVKSNGARSFFPIATLTDVATAQCRAGRVREGIQNAQSAYADALAAFGAPAALTEAIAYTRAACLIALGQPKDAARLLDEVEPVKVSALAGDPNWGANVELARAQIALAQGDLSVAREHAGLAAPGFAHPGAEVYQVRALAAVNAQLAARAAAAVAATAAGQGAVSAGGHAPGSGP